MPDRADMFEIICEPDKIDGGYYAQCLSPVEYAGCMSQGDTPWEAVASLADAMEGVSEVLASDVS